MSNVPVKTSSSLDAAYGVTKGCVIDRTGDAESAHAVRRLPVLQSGAGCAVHGDVHSTASASVKPPAGIAPTRANRGVPSSAVSPEIAAMVREIEAQAKAFGLDPFATAFHELSPEELHGLAAKMGFPKRYPHWRFGMEFLKLHDNYISGRGKIYELVINTDPSHAYLMSNNSIQEQRTVIAHVFAHTDFFKNNYCFKPTHRKMVDRMATNGMIVESLMQKLGRETVEDFIDKCLSLENLLDRAGIFRVQLPEGWLKKELPAPVPARKAYIESMVPKAKAEELKTEPKKSEKFPAQPEIDVLQFLIDHAPMEAWQKTIMTIVREEMLYFVPQMMTKIMNEGWASFWHERFMTGIQARDSEIVCFAQQHAGVVANHPGQLNPYRLGIEIFKDIEKRFGTEKMFEVRANYNDITFLKEFLTFELAQGLGYLNAKPGKDGATPDATKLFAEFKDGLLAALGNGGNPIVYISDAKHNEKGELLLTHKHEGVDLKEDYAKAVLEALVEIWQKPVYLDTVMDERAKQWKAEAKGSTIRVTASAESINPETDLSGLEKLTASSNDDWRMP